MQLCILTHLSKSLLLKNPPLSLLPWYDLRSSLGCTHTSPVPRDRGLSVNSPLEWESSNEPDREDGLSEKPAVFPVDEPGLSTAFCPKRTLSSKSRIRSSSSLSFCSNIARVLLWSAPVSSKGSLIEFIVDSFSSSFFKLSISSFNNFSSSVSDLKCSSRSQGGNVYIWRINKSQIKHDLINKTHLRCNFVHDQARWIKQTATKLHLWGMATSLDYCQTISSKRHRTLVKTISNPTVGIIEFRSKNKKKRERWQTIYQILIDNCDRIP